MRVSKPVRVSIFVVCAIVSIILIVLYLIKHNAGAIQYFLALPLEKRIELSFTFISSLIGTLVAAFLAYMFALSQFKIQANSQAEQRRMDTTFDFHRELISIELAQARSETENIFIDNKTANNLDDFYSKLSEEHKRPIRLLLSYFRRLQLAVEYDRVHTDITLDLLAPEFLLWYHMWLTHLVPDNWTTKQQIDKLHTWIRKGLSTPEYERRRIYALEKRAELLSSNQHRQDRSPHVDQTLP